MEKIAKKPTLLSMLFGNNVDGVKIEDTESTYVESDYIASLKNGVLTPLKSENKKSSKKSVFSEGLYKFESTIYKMK